MSELDIIRAWKDKTYRSSLSADELAQLPEHPAGAVILTDDELASVEGGSLVCTPATPTISAASVLSVVASIVSVASYVSYQLGTGGTAVSCCPCPPPPPPYGY
jgi:mersacidin/lichenicidin family type 2 lantibiotic